MKQLLKKFKVINKKDILDLLKKAKLAYYDTDKPIMSDVEFDLLEQYAIDNFDYKPEHHVGSEPSRNKVELPVPMGSLHQVRADGSCEKWIGTFNTPIVVTPKLDGNSLLLHYTRGKLVAAYRRGDATEGQEITHLVTYLNNVLTTINDKRELFIRGEALVVGKFKYVNEYKNPRNFVAGMLNRKLPSKKLSNITFIPYTIELNLSKSNQLSLLKQLGFKVVPYFVSDSDSITEDFLLKKLSIWKEKLPFEIDGIVLDIDSASLRKKLGFETNSYNPKYARKFKVNLNFFEAKVVDVVPDVSKTGKIKPRVEIEPVDYNGVTITYLTAHNYKYVLDNKIGKGSTIVATRSGDVIPYIQEVKTPAKKAAIITKCPACSSDLIWNQTDTDLVCPNKKCDRQLHKNTTFFFKAIGVKNFSAGLIAKLRNYREEWGTVERILYLNEKDLLKVEGIKEKTASKIVKEIREALANIYEPYLMHGLGFFGNANSSLGTRKLEAIWLACEGDIDYSTWGEKDIIEDIMSIEGFKETSARIFAKGIKKYLQWRKKHQKILHFVPYTEGEAAGKFAGKSFVFSGFRCNDFEKYLVENGATISDSLTSGTTALFFKVGKHGYTGKYQKAKKLGVRIIEVNVDDSQLRNLV